jgi:hypothetical protein
MEGAMNAIAPQSNRTVLPRLTSLGHELDMSEQSFGWLEDSSPIMRDTTALRRRMDEEGYLYIRGFFPREIVLDARTMLLERLSLDGIFEPGTAFDEGIHKESARPTFNAEAARHQPLLDRVVFGPEIREFYTRYMDGPIRHFDYVWLRTMGRGHGTAPHCDMVYMGRGSHRLHTAWIPYGDVSLELGGLMILERSHLQAVRIKKYLDSDVDTYCTNHPDRHGRKITGALSNNPYSLREKFGGRWLTAEFQPGDLLTFRMDTIHASLDNHTQRVRLSTDTRYQRSDEPIDERWVGENPIAHGPASKVGLIS